MQRYAITLLTATFSAIAAFAAFNASIDPFGITGAPNIPGITMRDTRLLEDGGRVHIADRLARGGDASIILGSSRTVDGFPQEPNGWPGGITNAGMRGTNMFELGRAMALAARDPDLRCVVIGLDMDEFGTHAKAKATYWLSALSDGNREFSMARVSLSPNTFAASLQLIADNVTGGSPRVPWADTYEAGEQRSRYESGTRGIYSYYLGYRFDPDRVLYFEQALDALTANGVQVIGFIHPLHAWREEAMFRSGRSGDYFELRQTLADVFSRYSQRPVSEACSQEGSAILWDFSGFQSFATLPAPESTQTLAHESFYEPSHYLPHIGQHMLDRISGEAGNNAFDANPFGVLLAPVNVDASAENILTRRANWLLSPDGRSATQLLDGVIAENPTAELATPQYLNRDDWRGLEDALGRIALSDTHRLPNRPQTR